MKNLSAVEIVIKNSLTNQSRRFCFVDIVSTLRTSETVKSRVVVQWTAPATVVSAATQYRINYTMLNTAGIAGTYTVNQTVGAETTFTLYNMRAGIYIFIVTARNAYGYGVPSQIRSPVNGIGPAAPTNFTATRIRQTAIDFSWIAVTDPTAEFIIQYRNATSQDNYQNASSNPIAAPVRTYTVTGLVAATSYSFHIVAISNNILSLPSNLLIVTTDSVRAPQTPFYQEIWFIALVSSLGVLLVFIILVFFVRGERRKNKNGGRYVAQGENEKKPAVPPLPADEPDEEVKRPPLPDENHQTEDHFRHSDVEVDSLDSMDQYADLPHLSKFNEDGSFINAYGDSGLKSKRNSTDTTSFLGNYSEAKFEPNSSYHGGSYAPTLRSSYPGSPANTINPNNSAFSTFV